MSADTIVGPTKTDKASVQHMRKLSISNWLGQSPSPTKLPDLGAREISVLEILWASGSLTSHQVLEQLEPAALNLSTVQSTLERLHRKQLLERSKVGRAYVYSAAVTRANIISRLLHEIAENLADGDSAPMVSGFLEYLGKGDNDPSELQGRESKEPGDRDE